MLIVFLFYFFFQAEDGIRDGRVTGVQTCALPISRSEAPPQRDELNGRAKANAPMTPAMAPTAEPSYEPTPYVDRKSTRLNSSHPSISYAVFCLKKKKNQIHSEFIHIFPPLILLAEQHLTL